MDEQIPETDTAQAFVVRRDLKPAPDAMQLPSDAILVRVLGVDYVHVRTDDGGDLYLTRHGVPYIEHLKPANWHDSEWFEARRKRLEGTSVVFKVPTKPVNGKSVNLVVKYCRVGQDVPLATNIIYNVLNAEFNSPFEEFSLVEELRLSEHGPRTLRLLPKLPLAIYVPPELMQLWQTGRSENKIATKIAQHPGVEIDILRNYIMVYAWIYGLDAVEAFEQGLMSQTEFEALNARVDAEMHAKGFRMLDMKPKHIIVFPEDGGGLKTRDGNIVYRIVDFELLQRTAEYDAEVRSRRRGEYLVLQRDRFARAKVPFPEHLQPMQVMNVPYVFGHAESTGGHLWVVGCDPRLFDYFLPERWRKTPHMRLSEENQIYYTRSKDNIHLVWRVSRLGEAPVVDDAHPNAGRIRAYGYNSPFEAFSFAMALQRAGVPTTYPRAIYMTGHRLTDAAPVRDRSRFDSHRNIVTPSGELVLREGYDYITVWGYWNGPDEKLAEHDGEYFKNLNLDQARRYELLSQRAITEVIERTRALLAGAGFEDLDLRASHLLIAVDPKGVLRRDTENHIEARLCNLQFVKRL